MSQAKKNGKSSCGTTASSTSALSKQENTLRKLEDDCFQKLFKHVDAIATRLEDPEEAYILNSIVLRAMSIKMPETEEEMLEITGRCFREASLFKELDGKGILKLIQSYRKKKDDLTLTSNVQEIPLLKELQEDCACQLYHTMENFGSNGRLFLRNLTYIMSVRLPQTNKELVQLAHKSAAWRLRAYNCKDVFELLRRYQRGKELLIYKLKKNLPMLEIPDVSENDFDDDVWQSPAKVHSGNVAKDRALKRKASGEYGINDFEKSGPSSSLAEDATKQPKLSK